MTRKTHPEVTHCFERGGPPIFERVRDLEWLEVTGFGGWAGSTVSGANTRMYAGLPVAATRPPVSRVILVSKLEETLHSDSGVVKLEQRHHRTIHRFCNEEET